VRFAFDDEQLMFRDAVRDALAATCGAATVRAAWEDDLEPTRRAWAQLVEMGVIGMTAPETAGGLDMGPLDWVLLLEAAGGAALPAPLLETTAVALPLLATIDDPKAAGWVRAVVAGDAQVSCGFAESPYVNDADLFLMRDGDALHGVRRADVTTHAVASVDHARRLLSFDWAPSDDTLLCADAGPALDAAFDRGVCGAAAELVGLATHLIDVSVEYAKVRNQFGRAIGSFQAVKHQLANALIAVRFAQPMVYRAAHSLVHDDPLRSVHVSTAKHHASEAAVLASRVALQVHGAIGYAFEYDLHMWMKRAWALAKAWGDPSWHRDRVAEVIL